MTQEDKNLLLKDLCARLPYGVIYHRNDGANIELREVDIKNRTLNYTDNIVVRECKPYLRPMSSMTEEERKYLQHHVNDDFVDYCNEHYLDYRGLISMGLAVKAPKDMYKTE